MKKITLAILAFILVSVILISPTFAEEKLKNIILQASETINHDYFAGGDTVQVSGTVNGDAYVGGGTVIVDGKINGDLIVAGGNITITGNVQGDIRAGGGNVTLTGANVGGNVTLGAGNVTIDKTAVIQGSIVAGGGNIQVLAPIGRGATIGGGTVLLANSIGGNVLAGVGELSLTPNAKIAGDLTYWSENKASVANGATVSGIIKQEIPREKDQIRAHDIGKQVGGAITGFFITLKIVDFAWLTIIGLVFIYLFPNYTMRASDFAKNKLGRALLIGLIALIVLPITGAILFITLFGIPAAIVLFFTFFIMLWIGRVFALYALGRFILSRTNNKNARAWAYVVGVIAYVVISLVPVVNFIADILVVLSGIGAMLATKREYYLDLRKKKLL